MFPTKTLGRDPPACSLGLSWDLNLKGRKQMKKKIKSLILTIALRLGLTVQPVENTLHLCFFEKGVGFFPSAENP
jgi:hypothetical protein